MTDDLAPRQHYSRDLATRAMRRAARLQVEAAELAERHSAPEQAEPPDGYAREELVAAAREAGIDEEFVSLALAELDDAATTNALALPDEAQENAATRWLGTTQRNVLVSRSIEGPIAEIWAVIGQVFESSGYGLKLQRVSDGHPTEGGMAHFFMTSVQRMVNEHGGSYSMLCYRMAQLELKTLRLRLHPRGERTQVTLYGDLRDGVGVNLRWARRTGVGFGLMTGGGATAATVALGTLAAVGSGLLGVLGGAMLAVGMWRLSYRHALRGLEKELEQMLVEVEGKHQSRKLYGHALPSASPSDS